MSKTITQCVVARARALGADVYERHQWGTAYPDIYETRRRTRPVRVLQADTLWAHITVTFDTGHLVGDFFRDMRTVERIGWQRFGSGFSYNFGIDNDAGRIGVGMPLDAKGTHTVNDKGTRGFTYDQNHAGRAWAFLGVPGDKLSPAARRAAVILMAAMILEDALTDDPDHVPHSLVAAKDCPTDTVRDALPGIKRDALALVEQVRQAEYVQPGSGPKPVIPQEEPMPEPYTGRTVVLGTFNLAGVTQSSEKSTDNMLSALPGVDLAFMQEALKVKVRRELSKLLGVHQDRASAATRGVAIAWDRQTVEKDGRKRVTLGSRRAPGVRDRHLIHVDVELEDRLTVRAIAGHRPLQRTGKQPEFDDTLRQLVDDSPHPVIVGIDCNDRDLEAWAKRLGLRWYGVGIDGFAVTPGIKLVNVRRQKATGSDHRPVTAVLQVGPSRKAAKR